MSACQVSRDRLWRFGRDGKCGTLVDSPAVIAKDRATARETVERSYQIVYDACDIRYWEVFTGGKRKGQFRQVVLAEPWVGKKQRFRRFTQEDAEASVQSSKANDSPLRITIRLLRTRVFQQSAKLSASESNVSV